MKVKLQRIGVLSLAKMQAAIMAIAGLIAGILYSGGGLIVDLLTIGLNLGTLLAFGAIIGMPVIFAATGFVAGAVGAICYNGWARWFGGIRVDLDLVQEA